MKRWHFLLAVLLSGTAAVHTLAQTPMKGTGRTGRHLFYSAALSTNGLSCADCHADFDESKRSDGRFRAAHSLYNGARRETWWGRDPSGSDPLPDIATAAVVCVEHYMRNPRKLTAQQLLNLQTYLLSITPIRMSTPQAVAPAADRTGEYLGFEDGDRYRGRELFYAACHTCHPNGNAGIAPAIPRGRDPSFYARKIREGDGLGSVLSGIDPNAYDKESGQFMPFFGADRLSDQQIRDLIAYLKSLPPP